MPPESAIPQSTASAPGSVSPNRLRHRQSRGGRGLAVPGGVDYRPAGLPPVAGRPVGGTETDPTSTHTPHTSSDPVGGTVSGRLAIPSLAWSAWPCIHPDVTQPSTVPTRPSTGDAVTRGSHPTPHLTPTTVPTPDLSLLDSPAVFPLT
jgi:hypothetical protein